MLLSSHPHRPFHTPNAAPKRPPPPPPSLPPSLMCVVACGDFSDCPQTPQHTCSAAQSETKHCAAVALPVPKPPPPLSHPQCCSKESCSQVPPTAPTLTPSLMCVVACGDFSDCPLTPQHTSLLPALVLHTTLLLIASNQQINAQRWAFHPCHADVVPSRAPALDKFVFCVLTV